MVPEPDDNESAIVGEWSREPNLDFLRSFAVLCVVARHLAGVFDVGPRSVFQPQALGLFGVLLFFVHTSLVLMLSLDRQWKRGQISPRRVYVSFIVRRLFRIYPLSVVAVLLVFVAVPPGDPEAQKAGLLFGADAGVLWANLLLIQDLVGRESLLAPLWSLPAEVHMYLILPALYFLGRVRGANAIRAGAWPIAVAVALATWALNLPFTAGRYAPCFVAGVVCYGLLRVRRPVPFSLFPLALVGVLIAYMAAYASFGLQAGLGIVVTIGLAPALPLFARMRATWLKSVSHTLAKYSYGIYLFHTPCIWIAFGKLKWLGPAGSFLTFVAGTGLMAVAAYHALEAPMIRLGQAIAARLTYREVGTPRRIATEP